MAVENSNDGEVFFQISNYAKTAFLKWYIGDREAVMERQESIEFKMFVKYNSEWLLVQIIFCECDNVVRIYIYKFEGEFFGMEYEFLFRLKRR